MAPQRDHRERIIKAGSAECQRLCRKPDAQLKFLVDEERLTLAQIWDVPDHIKSVERLRREADAVQREREYEWRKFCVRREFSALNSKVRHRLGASTRAVRLATSPYQLPSYSLALRDKGGRLFPFMRTSYSKASTAKAGRGRQLVLYQTDGAYILPDGSLAVASNVGDTPEEMAEAFNQIELVNRSAAKNAKIVHHMIIQSLFELSPEEQFAMAMRYCEQTFAKQGLPYVLAMHPPDPDGDRRNWHFHISFSYRPMQRTGPGEWNIDRFLRTDLDTPEGWKQMRFLLAEELNHTCEKHGLAKRYTHLSYAASGLDYIPQEHLGPGLNAKVRRGEIVGVNARNHRRVACNEVRHAVRTFKAALLAQTAHCRRAAAEQLNVVKMAAAVAASRPAASTPSMLRSVTMPSSLQTGIHSGGQANDDRSHQTRSASFGFMTKLTVPPASLNRDPMQAAPASLSATLVSSPPQLLDRQLSAGTIRQVALHIPTLPSKLANPLSDIQNVRVKISMPSLPARLEPKPKAKHNARAVRRPIQLPKPPVANCAPSRSSTIWRLVMPTVLPKSLANPVAKWPTKSFADLTSNLRLPSSLGTRVSRSDLSAIVKFGALPKLPSALSTGYTLEASERSPKTDLNSAVSAPRMVGEPATGARNELSSGAPKPGTSSASKLNQDDRGEHHDDLHLTQAASASDPADNLGADLRRVVAEQDDDEDEVQIAGTTKPDQTAPNEQRRLDLEAIFRRLDKARAQLSQQTDEDLPPTRAISGDAAIKRSPSGEPIAQEAAADFNPEQHRATGSAANANTGHTLRHDQNVRAGFKVSDKVAAAMRKATAVSSGNPLVRGLDPAIDRWMEADGRNDRDERRRLAAVIEASPAAKAKVRRLDRHVQVRFERDWEQNRISRIRRGIGRDGRNITDE